MTKAKTTKKTATPKSRKPSLADRQLATLRKTLKKYASDLLSETCILAIDPSVGSSSSLPGYAAIWIDEDGEPSIWKSGTIEMKPLSHPMPKRVARLRHRVEELVTLYQPSVLAVEHIPHRAFRGGAHKTNAMAHASILAAMGAAISAGDEEILRVLVPPVVWRRYIDDDWEKGDEADAIAIGMTVYHICKEHEDKGE